MDLDMDMGMGMGMDMGMGMGMGMDMDMGMDVDVDVGVTWTWAWASRGKPPIVGGAPCVVASRAGLRPPAADPASGQAPAAPSWWLNRRE
eukprot:5867052-Prymnesium_polylepis.1